MLTVTYLAKTDWHAAGICLVVGQVGNEHRVPAGPRHVGVQRVLQRQHTEVIMYGSEMVGDTTTWSSGWQH